MFSKPPSRLLWEAFSHPEINARRLFLNKSPPLSIASDSFIHTVKWTGATTKNCSRLDMAAQDSNSSYLSQESEALTTAPMFSKMSTTVVSYFVYSLCEQVMWRFLFLMVSLPTFWFQACMWLLVWLYLWLFLFLWFYFYLPHTSWSRVTTSFSLSTPPHGQPWPVSITEDIRQWPPIVSTLEPGCPVVDLVQTSPGIQPVIQWPPLTLTRLTLHHVM